MCLPGDGSAPVLKVRLTRGAILALPARRDDDRSMSAGWLAGRAHPATGAPLAIRHLELPPGSLVSFPAHMPHFVSPRRAGTGTRCDAVPGGLGCKI